MLFNIEIFVRDDTTQYIHVWCNERDGYILEYIRYVQSKYYTLYDDRFGKVHSVY